MVISRVAGYGKVSKPKRLESEPQRIHRDLILPQVIPAELPHWVVPKGTESSSKNGFDERCSKPSAARREQSQQKLSSVERNKFSAVAATSNVIEGISSRFVPPPCVELCKPTGNAPRHVARPKRIAASPAQGTTKHVSGRQGNQRRVRHARWKSPTSTSHRAEDRHRAEKPDGKRHQAYARRR